MHGRNRRILTGRLLNATAAIAFATGLSACSIVPGWVDPTTWFGSDAPDSADAAPTPDLANLPTKPGDASVADPKIADSLAADLKNAKHSADVLRGGTDTPAPAPPKPGGTLRLRRWPM